MKSKIDTIILILLAFWLIYILASFFANFPFWSM